MADYKLSFTAEEIDQKLNEIKPTDQSFDSESENPQSGLAVEEAIQSHYPCKRYRDWLEENPILKDAQIGLILQFNAQDLTRLMNLVESGDYDEFYDFDGDGVLTEADTNYLYKLLSAAKVDLKYSNTVIGYKVGDGEKTWKELPVNYFNADYKYNPNSKNAQSGIAIESAIKKSIRGQENKNGSWVTRKPFVTFTIDDGSPNDITILKPIFQKYNVPCCPALIIGEGKWAEVSDLEERLDLQNNHGWEHMCHGVDETPFNQKNAEQVETEIVASKTKLEELGFIINDIAYPSGAATSLDGVNMQPIVKKYFRAGYGFNPHPSIYPNTGMLNSYNIKRVPLGSFTFDGTYNGHAAEYWKSLEYYKECVDYAVANNAWCIFCMHTSGTNLDETQQQHLDDLIAYIQSIGVDIGNLTEGYELFGNYIECGDPDSGFVVTNEGEYNLPTYRIKGYSVLATTPLSEFPMDKLSVCEVINTNKDGFPGVGTLFTSRFTNYGFQILHINGYGYLYGRRWNATSNNWIDWENISVHPNSDRVFNKFCQMGQGYSNTYHIQATTGIYIRSIHICSSTNNVIPEEEVVLKQQFFPKS